MKPFLIIKTGGTFDEFTKGRGDFEHWAASAMGLGPSEWESVNVQAGDQLPDPSNYAGCVITGSHDMVTEDQDWIHDTADWIRNAAEKGLPMVGICFGHQLLAMTFGGEAGFHPDGPEIGTMDIRLTDAASDDPIFSQTPCQFPGHATHYQCALSIPSGAALLATSDHEPHQAFRYGDHVWGIQFHPEFDAETMRYYVVQQAEKIEEHGGSVDGLLSNVKETPESTAVMVRFVEYCRGR